jgi:hypothetical protein
MPPYFVDLIRQTSKGLLRRLHGVGRGREYRGPPRRRRGSQTGVGRASIALTVSLPHLMVKSRLPKQMDASGVHSTREPPSALTVVSRLLGGWGQASGALIASPSLLKGKSRLPKRIVVPGGRLSSWPAIWSLDDFVVERASPQPSAQSVGVSYLVPTSKFIVRIPGSRGVSGGRKIYTGSDRTSLHLVIGGLRYR